MVRDLPWKYVADLKDPKVVNIAGEDLPDIKGMQRCLQMCFDDICSNAEGRLSKRSEKMLMKYVNTSV